MIYKNGIQEIREDLIRLAALSDMKRLKGRGHSNKAGNVKGNGNLFQFLMLSRT